MLESSERDPEGTRARNDLARLKSQVLRAHQDTIDLARQRGHHGNMGATLVCLWLRGGQYLVGAVGDSRGYLLREGQLDQISEDHTMVNRYVSQGLISRQEARSHPQRNVLMQAMGMGEVEPDIFAGELRPGDRFLLSSDGVHDLLEAKDLGSLLGKAPDPETAGRAILRLVEERNGADDATVMVVFV
jgi:protein phosphatase